MIGIRPPLGLEGVVWEIFEFGVDGETPVMDENPRDVEEESSDVYVCETHQFAFPPPCFFVAVGEVPSWPDLPK